LLVFSVLLIYVFSMFVSAQLFINGQLDTNSGIAKVLISLGINGDVKDVILGCIILLILFAAFYDILLLVGLFQSKWVLFLISGGLAIAAALTNWVSKISLGLMRIGAGFGAFAVFFEIIVVFVVFVGLSLGSTWASNFAAKRHAYRAKIAAIKGSGDVVGAIKGLKAVQKEFEKK